MKPYGPSDPTPQRWLEAGEVMRRTEVERDPDGRFRGFAITEHWTVPPTLRLLPSDVRDLKKAGLRG